jgi:hypothetical protein
MADAIDAFWTWWKTASASIHKAVEARDIGPVDDDITSHVQAVDEGLKWELGPGADGKLAFAMVWNGSLERRRLSERWLERAPADDPAWEFHAARPPGQGWQTMTMELGPHKINFGEFTCELEVDESSERVNITVFHAATAKAPENVRGTAAYVMLDRAFGEDGVDRWLGVIELATKKPKKAQPIDELVAAVAALEESATGEQFALYEGERDEAPVLIVKNEALKAIDYLDCDHELAIAIGYETDGDHGLPSEEDTTAIDALEDALVEELAGAAAYHGRETSSGTRTLYFFAPANDVAAQRIKAWQAKQQRPVEVTWTADPLWEGLSRWD